MELTDLRRQWRQAAPAPPGPPVVLPNLADLRALAARRSGDGLLTKLRRNARIETGLSIAALLVTPVLFARVPGAFNRMMLALVFALSGVMLYYFYRKLRLLRRLDAAEADVLGHLRRLCAGLREMLRFYYGLSLASGPVTLALAIGFMVGHELNRPAGVRPTLLFILVVFNLLWGAVVQFAAARGVRWYLQKLYGQHLDRLEANLRELTEPAD